METPGARERGRSVHLAYWSTVRTTPHIGVSTSAYSELMLPAALERISEHATLAEIRSFGLHTLLSARNRSEAQQAGLTYTVHGPFGSSGVGDPDEAARLAALAEHRRHLEASAEIGALLYVVHPDWRPEVKPRDPAVVTQLQRSFETLRCWQDDLGVAVVVENMPGPGSHFTHPGDLDLCGLGLVLDVGHASISGCLDEWLDGPRARLRHLHLHDNHGEGDHDDPHLGLGQGVIDVASVVGAAREAGASAVLEHYSDRSVRTSLARLRELGLL